MLEALSEKTRSDDVRVRELEGERERLEAELDRQWNLWEDPTAYEEITALLGGWEGFELVGIERLRCGPDSGSDALAGPLSAHDRQAGRGNCPPCQGAPDQTGGRVVRRGLGEHQANR